MLLRTARTPRLMALLGLGTYAVTVHALPAYLLSSH